MPKIYSPSEDSYLLSTIVKDFVKKYKPRKILDMGSGSGIQTLTCINQGLKSENVFLADINQNSINYLKNKFPKSKVIQSDLFKNIKGKFDLIIFNPPYLPDNKYDKQKDTTGGKKGSEVINKFLKQAHKYLNKDARILLLTSSLTEGIRWGNYNKKLITSKKLFFEELYVYEIWLKKLNPSSLPLKQ